MFFHTFSERLEMSFTMLFEADTVFGSLVFRECMHFSTLPEGPVMQGRLNHIEHRGSQRVVIFIFSSFCTLCGFPKLYFENIKKSPGFWSPQREMPKTRVFLV
jgi:hypothetical protein